MPDSIPSMDALEGWKDFNVAIVGATAALAGLVIVAASVNISDIVSDKSMTSRLASGIAGLVLAIAGSAVGLIPGLTQVAYGVVAILFGLIASLFAVEATTQIFRNKHPENRMRPVKAGIGFGPPAAYVVGGALLLLGVESGLVWFAAGSIVAIVAALLVSWIVLVEVLR